MEINYQSTAHIIDTRLKQINDASKEYVYFSEEYQSLKTIRAELSKLILLERQTVEDMEKMEVPTIKR